MEPIKLVEIITRAVEDDLGADDLVTKYEYIYDYDEHDNEIITGIKIIDSCQYCQEDADRDWKETLKWIKEDEKRIDSYGYSWYSMGIQAVATLHFPYANTKSSIIQTIESPGVYGIESDSDIKYIKEVEEQQVSILLDMLERMHVNLPDNFACRLEISGYHITIKGIKEMYRA